MMFLFSRHPSNLMLDRLSGKILHIDFGDCFEVRGDFPSIYTAQNTLLSVLSTDSFYNISETDHHYNLQQVAMTREKFPEKIPFRLTRMLTNAMEVYNSAVSYAVIHTHTHECITVCGLA